MLNDWYVMQLLQEYLMAWVSLERKSYNDTNSPSTPPYAKLKLEKNCFFVGWGEGLGMYGCEESSTNANGSQDFCP